MGLHSPWGRKESDMTERLSLRDVLGFAGDLFGKESACNAGDMGSTPGLGRSAVGGHGNPLPYSCLENPHGQKSLVGYSPRGYEEHDSDTQTRLSNQAQHSTAPSIQYLI